MVSNYKKSSVILKQKGVAISLHWILEPELSVHKLHLFLVQPKHIKIQVKFLFFKTPIHIIK
jgi:hypothetical protein